MSEVFTAQLYPKQALGFLVIGAPLHDVLTRLKAEPYRFPLFDLIFDPRDPVREPVILNLPENGMRLRFDGPEQRLRLIEILDFSLSHITLKREGVEQHLVRPTETSKHSPRVEPTFKHIYQRFMGMTYDGEFVPAENGSEGTYVLSWPGVAFSFAMKEEAYSPEKNHIALLSPTQVATSMAIFADHESWMQARSVLWTETLPSIKTFSPLVKGRDVCPDEVSLIKIHGGGKLQLFKQWTDKSTWLRLGESTPQDLVAEFGPPDAIYRKNDQRMFVHKIRTTSTTGSRPNGMDIRGHRAASDADQSSAYTLSDDSTDEAAEDEAPGTISSECFYNYFYLGFDVLVSKPTPPSQTPPAHEDADDVSASNISTTSSDSLVATKLIIHGNVPGSYPFNRHRRCRWEIAYLPKDADVVNSETPFKEAEKALQAAWRSTYPSEDAARQQQRGMTLNRGWGESPGSSLELMGGWEESSSDRVDKASGEDSTTTLFGFPGLVFEVLRNGFVSDVTVF